jgi:hypothetical protein
MYGTSGSTKLTKLELANSYGCIPYRAPLQCKSHDPLSEPSTFRFNLVILSKVLQRKELYFIVFLFREEDPVRPRLERNYSSPSSTYTLHDDIICDCWSYLRSRTLHPVRKGVHALSKRGSPLLRQASCLDLLGGDVVGGLRVIV